MVENLYSGISWTELEPCLRHMLVLSYFFESQFSIKGGQWDLFNGGGGLVTKLCPTLVTPWTNPPGTSVRGISQARILEWVAISSSRGSSQPRDQTCISCIAGGFFYYWATREVHLFNRIVLHISENQCVTGCWLVHAKKLLSKYYFDFMEFEKQVFSKLLLSEWDH